MIPIRTPPNIELKTNFKIHFIGTIKILPTTNKIHIQEIIIRILISTLPPLETYYYYYFYVSNWTNITHFETLGDGPFCCKIATKRTVP